MSAKPLGERARELADNQVSREKALLTLYLERYPLSGITAALAVSSQELRDLSERLSLRLVRCPQGHELTGAPGLHVSAAHYCVKCGRWFTEGMLGDEVNLEVARLQEHEKETSRSP